jgi:hypothetical protein
MEPRTSQKEGQENKGTLKELRVVTLALLPLSLFLLAFLLALPALPGSL